MEMNLPTSVQRLGRFIALIVFISAAAAGAAFAQSSDRGGFTFLVSLGAGIQSDAALEETKAGIAGINFGVGGFIKPNMAILGRLSGTSASYDTDFGEISQTSGVFGPSLQYWMNDKVYVEGGVGVGFWNIEDGNDQGLGVLLGAGYTVWNRGKHNLQVAVEYAPVLTDTKVHNFGFTFGYQLF